MRRGVEGLARDLARLEAELAAQRRASEASGRALAACLDALDQRLAVLQRAPLAPRSAGPTPEPAAARAARPDWDGFYAAFEDRFRGTREQIRERQVAHLPRLERQEPRLAALPVIDLGCGRGEWLELLRERGIAARGVDLNRVFLAENAARGLEVVAADALAHLRGCPSGSARAITAFHVIEHLPFDVVRDLLDEALRVLAEGGFALFETPNPENLVTAARNFYHDPTHRRPIPPEAAAFLLRAHGFRSVEIVRLHTNPDPVQEEIASGFLRELLFGPQDYAVVGYR